MRFQGEQQIIRGEISDFKFYICEFNPAKRNATKHYVVQPCTITLNAKTPEARGMNVSLTTSDVRINISPAIIELLNKTVNTLTAGTDGSCDASLCVAPDYSDIWGTKPYTSEDYWFMKVGELEIVTRYHYREFIITFFVF